MPPIEIKLRKLNKTVHLAEFDFSHSYWQLPLHKVLQAWQSFITPDGVYTPARVLHGTTNFVLYLQSTNGSKLPAAPVS